MNFAPALSRVLLALAIVAVAFVAPPFIEGANTSCGAYLARSAKEQGAPELAVIAVRAGVIGSQWTGAEAATQCTYAYWASHLDRGALYRLPADDAKSAQMETRSATDRELDRLISTQR